MSTHAPRRGPTSHVLTAEENRRGGSGGSARKSQAAKDSLTGYGKRRLLSPELAREDARRGGKAAMRRQYGCGECSLISTACGLASHQRSKSHEGRHPVPLETFDDYDSPTTTPQKETAS